MQPHHYTPECNKGYLEWYYDQHVLQQGECRVWTGIAKRGVPYININEKPNSKNAYRAVAVALERQGVPVDKFLALVQTCSTDLCVNLDHFEARPNGGGNTKIWMDAAPLLARFDAKRVTTRTSAMAQALGRARKTGKITVDAADEICIESLGVHPYEVFGEAFFDAA